MEAIRNGINIEIYTFIEVGNYIEYIFDWYIISVNNVSIIIIFMFNLCNVTDSQ